MTDTGDFSPNGDSSGSFAGEAGAAAESAVIHIEAEEHKLLAPASRAIGFHVAVPNPEPLALKERPAGRPRWYFVAAVCGLASLFELVRTLLLFLAPNVSAATGISKGTVGLVATVSLLMVVPALVATVWLSYARQVRATGALLGGLLVALFAILLALSTTSWAFFGAAAAAVAVSATGIVLHRQLLVDAFPPGTRTRVLATYRGVEALGFVVAMAMIALASSSLDLTWRAVFLAAGILAVAVTALSLGLRDPGYGRLDDERIRGVVRQEERGEAGGLSSRRTAGARETLRRVLRIPTLGRLLTGYTVAGMLANPTRIYLSSFFQAEWQMDLGERALWLALVILPGVVVVWVYGRWAAPVFSKEPSRVLRVAGAGLLIGPLLIFVGVLVAQLAITIPLLTVGLAAVLLAPASLDFVATSIVRAEERSVVCALTGAASIVMGGLIGLSLLSSIQHRFGYVPAFGLLLLPGVAAYFALRHAARTLDDDIAGFVTSVIEEAEIDLATDAGKHLPLIVCHHIDFSYGQLQVLFDVSFRADDGEIVALLGTNGAGKSTLLRVICGLGIPERGSVRYRGREITYLAAEPRVSLGISQIPGGKAIFGPLSVVENLQLYGYSLGKHRKELDRGIERVMESFPILGERRNQPAATLSGGQQQMLALGKALIVKPSLLLIDELSLGLAPVVVSELLNTVRQIRDDGTTIVLVEQSVNLALTLADRAYFMEKGAVRFEGPAAGLIERTDLLRSVFLEGATEAFSARETT